MKELRAKLSHLRSELRRAKRTVQVTENRIDRVEIQLMEKRAGCKRGDVVRYTSGKFFLPHHRYVLLGNYMEVVALGKMSSQYVIHLRLLEEPITYPKSDSNSDVYFNGSPAMFWRHFTAVGPAELKRVKAQIAQHRTEMT
jgi:hypothetical protein